MSTLLDVDDDGECVYSSDWSDVCPSRASSPRAGIRLTLTLGSSAHPHSSTQDLLSTRLVFPDCASWIIPSLDGVCQEGGAHGGFRGCVSDLLRKLSVDIDMMRGAYPPRIQTKFDEFLRKIEGILDDTGDRIHV